MKYSTIQYTVVEQENKSDAWRNLVAVTNTMNIEKYNNYTFAHIKLYGKQCIKYGAI